ncbi:transposase [Actinomadura sp. 9N215]|uniref:transposase n=1 Tax=Actinomadura sp. 9N215 TaxID=3375150 RepID=UPI00379C051C
MAAAFPATVVQTCVVHLIRNALRPVARRDAAAVAKHAFQHVRLVEGQHVAGWREALNELAVAHPGRIR